MRCPYCHTDYSDDHPCFCQPPAERKRSQREEYYTKTAGEELPAVNSHRGVRLD